MIQWYKDDELEILFDKVPEIKERFITPWSTELEQRDIKKYPYVMEDYLTVKIIDLIELENYVFTIPKEFTFDGASIVKFFHRIIGSNTNNTFLVAAACHDYMCIHKDVIDNNKALSTNVFNALLKVGGVGSFKRFWMKNAVALFQTVWVRDWKI